MGWIEPLGQVPSEHIHGNLDGLHECHGPVLLVIMESGPPARFPVIMGSPSYSSVFSSEVHNHRIRDLPHRQRLGPTISVRPNNQIWALGIGKNWAQASNQGLHGFTGQAHGSCCDLRSGPVTPWSVLRVGCWRILWNLRFPLRPTEPAVARCCDTLHPPSIPCSP